MYVEQAPLCFRFMNTYCIDSLCFIIKSQILTSVEQKKNVEDSKTIFLNEMFQIDGKWRTNMQIAAGLNITENLFISNLIL